MRPTSLKAENSVQSIVVKTPVRLRFLLVFALGGIRLVRFGFGLTAAEQLCGVDNCAGGVLDTGRLDDGRESLATTDVCEDGAELVGLLDLLDELLRSHAVTLRLEQDALGELVLTDGDVARIGNRVEQELRLDGALSGFLCILVELFAAAALLFEELVQCLFVVIETVNGVVQCSVDLSLDDSSGNGTSTVSSSCSRTLSRI